MYGWIQRWRLYHGTHVITCPENLRPAAVRVNTRDADLHLRTCSRWPEMAGCDEACLSQIEAAPHACRVQAIVAQWYDKKRCHFCARPIGEIVWHERPPALRTRDGRTREWKDVAPQELPDVFATAAPVCWACHVVETFRREHPELVVERARTAAPRHTIKPSASVY